MAKFKASLLFQFLELKQANGLKFDVYACLDCNCWKLITVQCRIDSGDDDRKKIHLIFAYFFNFMHPFDAKMTIKLHCIDTILKNSTTLQIFTARLRSYTRAEFACYHFFPIYEFSYKLIRFLLHSPEIRSDNEIGRFSLELYLRSTGYLTLKCNK